ncbi:iron-siderophore ABC transporter substrate-binding protein [Mobilicoccus caccae]|uniref:ABC transporter substrate-binding protein n=1 Tax=Mobilicoccus caccae TaxID=1859295 RepID=A0ABQ6IUW9_9MICO|nr:iron-siderophore ABC transporter substrate-binding protein [Mobilicoccus caccae]GMA40861.1 ABC transporter substrate-binding protein [Mobilicoccus caccae]
MSTRSISLTAATLTLTLGLAACGSSPESSAPATSGPADTPAAAAFPVTIKHTLGETTVAEQPQRVATVGWANHEVPLALGVTPVGMAKADYGDDDGDGVLPWVEEKLTELGATTPQLFDETDGIDFEAVANTQPDVILAAYSGLTKEDYATLSKIAPVVAYPDQAWGTSMNDMIRLNSQAIGKKAEGEQLVADLDRQISETAAKYPNLAGKSGMFAFLDPSDLSKVQFYNTRDPRAGLLQEAGLTVPAKVTEATQNETGFFSTVSAENTDAFSDVDVIVSYSADPAAALKSLQADPRWAKIPAVKSGAVALLKDNTPLAASGNPSPLNIPWGLDAYLKTVNDAVGKAT